MRKHKNLIIFLILAFWRSIFLGMMKFFLRSYLQDIRTLQEIAWYTGLGWTLAYLVAWSLAYAFTKKKIILWSVVVCIGSLFLGYFTHYTPFLVFTLLVSVMWFIYSIWLTIKSVILSTEIMSSWLGETTINGMTNIAILAGFLLGSYRGFGAYNHWWAYGFLLVVIVLIVCGILSLFLNYDTLFTPKPFLSTLKQSVPTILEVIEKYFWFLVPIAVLWSVSTVMGQKMLEIGIDTFDKMPKASIFVLAISLVWAIVGNIISAFFKGNQKWTALIFLIIFGVSVILFPYLLDKHTNFMFLNVYSFAMGCFFGISANIIEGRYFHLIGDDHRKEYGAAAYGIISSIVMFFVMITSDLVTRGLGNKFSFFFAGIIILINIFFINHLDQERK